MTRRNFIESIYALFVGCGLIKTSQAAVNSESQIKPRHVICFLGEWKSLAPVEQVINEFGAGFALDREYSVEAPDERMQNALSASLDLVSNTFTNEDWARVKRHRCVAYVLSPPIDKSNAISISNAALEITARLISTGATAVKSESAGIAHGLDYWINLAQKKAHRLAWVRRPIGQNKTLYSCGMHLLGQRDIECIGAFEDLEAVKWIDTLAEMAISDQKIPSKLSIGNVTKNIRFVACERYPDDDFFFNPYGYISVST